jgi:hypothetical protein
MSSSGCHSGGKRIEEEVERRDVAIAGDDEVGAGIGRGLAWPTRHPLDASGRPTEVLGFTDRRVAEIGVGRFDGAGYPVDLIPAAVDAPGRVEQGVLGENVSSMTVRRRSGSFSPNTSRRLRVRSVGMLFDMAGFPNRCTRWQSYEVRRSLNPRQ